MTQSYTRALPVDTDGTLSSNSDILVASQKATKTYVDGHTTTFNPEDSNARIAAEVFRPPVPLNTGMELVAGSLVFTGESARILGDFTTATLSQRCSFQTTTVNGNTSVAMLPNGTATASNFRAYNNSDPTNSAFGNMVCNSVATQVASGVAGTGTQLPLQFLIGATTVGQFDTTGGFTSVKGFGDTSYSVQTPLTGFTITIAANVSTLILTPAGTLATGTINMPASPFDGQEVRVSSTQTITALTVSGNGHTLNNAPTALTISAAGDYGFHYIFANSIWYRLQ